MLWCALCVLCHGAAFTVGEVLSGDNGLPHYQVNTIARDSKGYVWIGTRNGLSRYDGYGIRNYYNTADSLHSLRHNYVRKVFIDSSDRMWILTIHGLSRYDESHDWFINYPSMNGDMTAIAETSDGELLCGGESLWRYDVETDSFVRLDFDTDFVLSLGAGNNGNVYISTNHGIYELDKSLSGARKMPGELYEDFVTGAGDLIPLFVDSRNNLWIGRNGKGVERYNLDTEKLDILGAEQLPGPLVRVIEEGNDGSVILGTGQGIAVVDDLALSGLSVREVSDELSNQSVYAIMTDRDQNVWVGTYFGGVRVLTMRGNRFGHINRSNGLNGEVVRMMAEPGDGTLWIATEDGGISILNLSTGVVEPFTQIPELGVNVHALCHDRESNTMWIGSFRDGLFRYNLDDGSYRRYMLSNGLASSSVFYLAYGPDGKLYVATPLGMRRYDADTDMFECLNHPRLDWTFVYCLMPDGDGNQWIGTTTEGLYMMNREGEICQWPPEVSGEKLADKFVTSLCMDASGKLWVGTNNSGLQIIDPSTGEMTDMPEDHRTVCAICRDESGAMWVTTSTGVFKYDAAGSEIAKYTTDNGLPTNQMNLSSIYSGSDGKIYAGSINGLIYFNPTDTEIEDVSPEVHFKALWVNGSEVNPSDSTGILAVNIDDLDEISVRYDMCSPLTLEYGVIKPGSADVFSYQVMLEGVDTYWRNMGEERKVSFFNLPPGRYVLHIRANNTSNDWDELPVRSMSIIVAPPFYRSDIAVAIYLIAGFAGCFFAIRHYRNRKARSFGVTGTIVEDTGGVATVDSMEDAAMQTGNHVDREFMANVDRLISENLSNCDLCVDDITSGLGVSRTSLHTRIKSLTGMSISQYIRDKRFAEAKRLLADGYNVSETAYRCGFSDPNHFSKMFKRHFGVLPSKYPAGDSQ